VRKGQGKRDKAKGKREKGKGKREKGKGKRQKGKGKREKAEEGTGKVMRSMRGVHNGHRSRMHGWHL
jgi:hypothetical protein